MALIIHTYKKGVFESSRNNYEALQPLENMYGVYIFKSESGEILYVGEARKQNLKERVTQNFTKSDSGGTFRENYMFREGKSFSDFIETIKGGKFIYLTLEASMVITALESLLIHVLDPKFNNSNA